MCLRSGGATRRSPISEWSPARRPASTSPHSSPSAEEMARACSASTPAGDNPGLALGAVIGACANAGRDKLTLLTSPGVTRLGAWLEQLLAESTGKQGRGRDPGRRGAARNAGGLRDRPALRLHPAHDGDDDAAKTTRCSALEGAGQPVVRIELSDPHELGREFFRWEFATAVAGSIDRDQPVRSARRGGGEGRWRGRSPTATTRPGPCRAGAVRRGEDGLRLYADATRTGPS